MECAYVYWLLLITFIDGLSFLNEDGGLKVFFPNNSFVTNTSLTHTNTPWNGGNDHIVCYGTGQFSTAVAWRNSSGERLEQCQQYCQGCGTKCQRNGGVSVDPNLLRHTHIHMYTNSSAYVNQDLECRRLGTDGLSSFIGVYLKDGGESCLFKYSISLLEVKSSYARYTLLADSYIRICGFFKSRHLPFLHNIIILMKGIW